MSEKKELQSMKLGKIELAPEVLQIIAGLSASEVEGVAALSGGVVGDLSQLLGRKNLRQGIKVELEEQTLIKISLFIDYGYHVVDVSKKVQERVKVAIEDMTGVTVDQVVVHVEGLKFPQKEKQTEKETTHRVK
jgi:uncharacterized alkaline shock family protein YloU